ncbi:MAG: von Willebrand factor type A domain-containing protein, partial [Ginsengibacter sp.]
QINGIQNMIITGKVINQQGDPLIVQIKAGHTQVHSDANGNYRIDVDREIYLYFSAAGYESEKIRIGNSSVYNIVMKKNRSLNEFVLATEMRKTHESNAQKRMVQLQGSPSISFNGPGNYLPQNYHTEEYDQINENGFKRVSDDPLSTFSIDVDAASYSNVRRFLQNGQLPPAGAVRSEELINYFKYDYPQPTGKNPFSINTVLSESPWNKNHQLLLIGMQGKTISTENLPASNLVFLIDVSGSMMGENRLPLVKKSLFLLTDQLRTKDVISIVVYAGKSGVVLNAVSGENKQQIKDAINGLEAGGFTAGGAGIQLAYKTAFRNFIKHGNNRVILCTDGDFNLGLSSNDELTRLIEKEREGGVFLTVLGYGMGNYKDSKLQLLADKGNGNHAYIDGLNEAKKVLVNEFGGTLFTIAKDVKLQVEFNPEKVAGYRLIGYENRLLNKEDFNDDQKDAGELGSGHSVTALYEIIPAEIFSPFLKNVDSLKYSKNVKNTATLFSGELATVKSRYKDPDSDKSNLLIHVVESNPVPLSKAGYNFQFASAVAGFGMLLTKSEYKGNLYFDEVISLASNAVGKDTEGFRKEFVQMVKTAKKLEEEKGGD